MNSLEQPLSQPPQLWNPDAAGAWSILLSPIFGSFLIRRNWEAIGQDDKARTGKLWLIVSLFMIVPSLFIPFFGLFYLLVWYFTWQKPQTRFVRANWGNDYPRKPWGKPLIIGFACWLSVFGVMVFFLSMSAATWPD